MTVSAPRAHPASLLNTPTRAFFGSRKKAEEKKAAEAEQAEAEKAKAEESAQADEAKTESAEKEAAEEAKGGEAEKAAAEDSQAKAEAEPAAEEAKGGEEAAGEEEGGLSAKDVKRIKKLFNEQETEIKSLEKKIKTMEEEAERREKEIKLARIEYTKQVRENESTVQRYRKMIEDEKSFAISKFAKDLLEVRDAVRLALENTDVEKIQAEEDLEAIKGQYVASLDGQRMTAEVMDKVLERFKVVQYDPKGEKFDPTLHEAVFTVAQSEQENDTVEIVMQTGWKIGDRVLRAAKVGIVKK